MELGTEVTIEDFQGRTVATGSIVETFHWDGEPTLEVDKSNQACSFTYEVRGVPKLDSYDLWVGFVIHLKDITQGDLEYKDFTDEPYYEIELIRVGWD